MVNENLVIIGGNLTRDVEVKDLNNNGGQVALLGVATNRRWNDAQTGQQREEVTFTEWEVYGPLVNVVTGSDPQTGEAYLKKGSPVYFRGRVRFNSWQDQATGENRSRITFVVDRFEFQGTRASNGLTPGQPPANAPQANANAGNMNQPPANQTAPAASTPDDDIPF